MTDDEVEAMGRDILARQPFSQMLGAELVSLALGRSELRMALEERHTQHLGMAHGGVISSLADMALAFAGGPMMGDGAVTQEFKINFLRPGTGDALVARAEVVGSGRSQAVVRSDVFVIRDGEEKLCATAQGTIARGAR
ncbi:MAG: PaaI family thioesterase [Maritimibacter harenae]